MIKHIEIQQQKIDFYDNFPVKIKYMLRVHLS